MILILIVAVVVVVVVVAVVVVRVVVVFTTYGLICYVLPLLFFVHLFVGYSFIISACKSLSKSIVFSI